MEKRSGLSELSVISWVFAVEGCPLSGVPLYMLQEVVLILIGSWYQYTEDLLAFEKCTKARLLLQL